MLSGRTGVALRLCGRCSGCTLELELREPVGNCFQDLVLEVVLKTPMNIKLV